MINLLIVDDSPLIRKSLQTIVEQDPEIKVIGNAANGKTAAELCLVLHPDLVLMDIKMPLCDGVEGTRLIKESNSSIKVMILTTFNDDEYIEAAIQNGADGYLLKDIEEQTLISSIKNISKGYNILQSSVFEKLKSSYHTPIHEKTQEPTESGKIYLTHREQDITKLIVDGCSNKEIALRLGIAEGTARNIISNLLEKLELTDRTQLAVFAVKNNLI